MTSSEELRQRKADGVAGSPCKQFESGSQGSSSSTPAFGVAAPPQYHNYGCADAYAQAVRTWLWAYHSWQFAHLMAPIYMYQSMLSGQATNLSQQAVPTSRQAAAVTPSTTSPATPAQGAEHVVATYGRRLLAELIDFSFCFVLKLLVVYVMIELHMIDIEKYEKLLGDQADLKTFIDITQDLFPVEVANKIITSVLEALYITYGWGSVPRGFTPGKFLLGIKVVSCDRVTAFAPRDYRVIVEGEKPVSLGSSFVRSMIKNFCLSFLFPLCVTMYAFRFNRSLYDIAAGTVVVEAPRR